MTLDTQIRARRPARHLTVGLRSTGFALPAYVRSGELPIDLPGLEAIEALLCGTAVDDEASAAWQARLEERGLLADQSSEHADPPAAPLAVAAPPDHVDLSPTSAQEFVLLTPVLLSCTPLGFEYVDHDGEVRLRATARELTALAWFRNPNTIQGALDAWQREQDPEVSASISAEHLAGLVSTALAGGLIVLFDPDDPRHAHQSRQAEAMRTSLQRLHAVHQEFDRLEAEHDAAPGTRPGTRVIGFHTNWASPPSSLGMVLAAAMSADDGALLDHFDFRPRLMWDQARLAEAAGGASAIFLFSNYIWSTAVNLTSSAQVKALNSHHITVHGGPDTPKYPDDVQRWFREHPHVDVAVHGEGEATFVDLLQVLAASTVDGELSLHGLGDVAGLSYRDGDQVIQTAPRDRIADLNSIPSPTLTGLFDGFIPAGGDIAGIILETNRGCPYGCTFCDWGSATLSRIRQFDLDRVFAELTWCAENQLGVGLADANFGIFERDVQIAQKIADLKASYGFPKMVGNNYAKNTTKHLAKIIDIFTQVDIVAEGKLSMQSFDQGTLTTIRRKNIKVEKYHELSAEFRRNDLPLKVELMMGLPGATPDAFRADLQSCIDRDVRTSTFTTVLLPNSPMNDPEYRRENGIVAKPGEEIQQTASYDQAEFRDMLRLRNAYDVFENFAVLRQVATYFRAETGRREIDLYQDLVTHTTEDPQRWPALTVALQVISEWMVPPVSWWRFYDEVRDYLTSVVGIADDDALDTVLAVQHALIPARGRQFPLTLQLAHDYSAWHLAVRTCREDGHYDDWPALCAPLRSYPAGTFPVHDPLDSCGSQLGFPASSIQYYDNAWDLESPVSRPRQARPDD